MKRYILLLLFLAPVVLQAQTLIDRDRVVNARGATGDTLNKDASFTDSYYVKDFSVDSEIFWNIDSVSGRTSVTLSFEGSYNNSDWISIDETTLTVTSGDTTFVQSSGTYLYPYLKAKAAAVDSTQTTRVGYNLVIDKN